MRWLKTVLATSIIAWHIVSGLIYSLFVRDVWRRRTHFTRATSIHSRWSMRVFNIHRPIEGEVNARKKQNYLIVANHMSYLDVILLAGYKPAAFVTSMEMRETPVLGTITDMGGCVYVERRSRDNIHNEVGEIEEALRRGFNVVVFPEATSTNGEKVLNFKRPLFAAAVKAGVPVLPVVVQYDAIDGAPVTSANRDSLCWYGKMPFAGHFLGLMRMKRIDMRLKILPEIPVTAESTRDSLMEAAQRAIQGAYRPIPVVGAAGPGVEARRGGEEEERTGEIRV